MKISVFNTKWSAGKTPIATNIAFDQEYAVATNEPYSIYEQFIPEERLMHVDINDPFPQIPDDIDIVFDLNGTLSHSSLSITSALKQSDVVIVPIYNEPKAITVWLHTLADVLYYNKSIIVVATKLKQDGKLEFLKGWHASKDITNIKAAVSNFVSTEIDVMPLKHSSVFDLIFEKEKSINQLRQESKVSFYGYKEVGQQFDDIYSLINTYAKQK